ncbi:class I SAM-dependent methyltransferase [Pseudonocardia kujensis]|uniref:class I SAM-dependent methyltransferase n=1 Tax=Pseudonocardia kujensis TaxID=1128675 RepID=UPI001E3AE420|nr:class I SAM-dependent methyltransferase [Pseudonocardia kujensis]MCE0761486.1 class I SAM-dependent methyltransferase [Pseudonocardia kujensis]
MTDPTLGELTVGVEGLALLRLLRADDHGAARAARMAETRDLLDRLGRDPALQGSLGVELDLREGYARWAETYDGPLRLFSVEEPPMERRLGAWPAGAVLDAACGTGRYAVRLAGLGHAVVGIDRSPDMLERARAKVPGGRFLEGGLTDLPLPDASVDAAVCALALVHVPEVAPAVAELARVVRPGGRILVSDVHPVLVQLGWQAQFATGAGRAYMRLHRHQVTDYAAAALAAGLVVRGAEEPALTPEAAVTPTLELVPEATRAAYVGLPGVVIWEFARP